jgi:predicted nucleic acid-binding Zn ribbon protein
VKKLIFEGKKNSLRFQDEQSLKDLISQLVDHNKLKPKLLEAKLIAEWPRIIGEPIAKYTERVQVHKGQLILHISSPALRNELSFQRKALAALINKELDCDFIEDVIVK